MSARVQVSGAVRDENVASELLLMNDVRVRTDVDRIASQSNFLFRQQGSKDGTWVKPHSEAPLVLMSQKQPVEECRWDATMIAMLQLMDLPDEHRAALVLQ